MTAGPVDAGIVEVEQFSHFLVVRAGGEPGDVAIELGRLIDHTLPCDLVQSTTRRQTLQQMGGVHRQTPARRRREGQI